MRIIISHNKREKISLNDLVFKGYGLLHSNEVTMAPYATTLELDDIDITTIRMLQHCKLEDLTVVYGDEDNFEIANITIIQGKENYSLYEFALQKYQYMSFCGKRISKEEYQKIASEVHANDKKSRYFDIVESVLDNIDLEPGEIIDTPHD